MMGVVNVTPDSFSDGGQFTSVDQAASHGLALEASGAQVLDVGGESTRPGSAPVSTEEQIARVTPVIERIRAQTDVAISVDTTDASVAAAALAAGADLVNDISAFRFDDAMLPLLVRQGCPAIAMHTLAAPATMQNAPHYDDVVREVQDHLAQRVSAAVEAGVARSQLLIDPGIGFGKLLQHNLALLRGLASFRAMGLGVVVGTSRKRFLGEVTGRPVHHRDPASAASAALSIAYGADWVRVHDVAGSVDAVAVAVAIAQASSASLR
jgi:dihydropteroate synthase